MYIAVGIGEDGSKEVLTYAIASTESACMDTVRGKSNLDLKSQPGWKGYKYYVYEGELVRIDQPGNTSYGYLGKVFGVTDKKLFFAAGLAQGTSLPKWNGLLLLGMTHLIVSK